MADKHEVIVSAKFDDALSPGVGKATDKMNAMGAEIDKTSEKLKKKFDPEIKKSGISINKLNLAAKVADGTLKLFSGSLDIAIKAASKLSDAAKKSTKAFVELSPQAEKFSFYIKEIEKNFKETWAEIGRAITGGEKNVTEALKSIESASSRMHVEVAKLAPELAIVSKGVLELGLTLVSTTLTISELTLRLYSWWEHNEQLNSGIQILKIATWAFTGSIQLLFKAFVKVAEYMPGWINRFKDATDQYVGQSEFVDSLIKIQKRFEKGLEDVGEGLETLTDRMVENAYVTSEYTELMEALGATSEDITKALNTQVDAEKALNLVMLSGHANLKSHVDLFQEYLDKYKEVHGSLGYIPGGPERDKPGESVKPPKGKKLSYEERWNKKYKYKELEGTRAPDWMAGYDGLIKDSIADHDRMVPRQDLFKLEDFHAKQKESQSVLPEGYDILEDFHAKQKELQRDSEEYRIYWAERKRKDEEEELARKEKLLQAQEKLGKMGMSAGQQIASGWLDATAAMMEGDLALKDFGDSLGSVVGETLQKVGKQMVMYAIAQSAIFKTVGAGFKAMAEMNPIGLLAAGAALLVAGSLMKEYFGKGSSGKTGAEPGGAADSQAASELQAFARKLFGETDRDEGRVTILQVGDRQMRGYLVDTINDAGGRGELGRAFG